MIDYSVDTDGVATIAWNVTNRPMNVLNAESIAAFEAAVDEALADDAVKGVIVTSARKEFIVGADLSGFAGMDSVAALSGFVGGLHALMRRMEKGGKPFVAAINGHALGGGFELALACHRRIVADAPRLKLGQPESKVGLIPGGGGCQRLPRLIGIREALPLLLTLSSGVAGFTTIHAGSARQALSRLRFICQLADTRSELPMAALNALVTEAVDVVVHCSRHDGIPRVNEVVAVEDLQTGVDGIAFTTTELFRRPDVDGELTWTGAVPSRMQRAIAEAGHDLRHLLDTTSAALATELERAMEAGVHVLLVHESAPCARLHLRRHLRACLHASACK